MGQGVANLGAAQLILNINETGVSATGNYSSVAWSFYMNCGNGSSWNSNPTSWSANISGVGYSGTYTFDFRSTNSVLIAATSLNVGHAADGTLASSGSASTGYTGTSAIGGPGSVGANYWGSNIAPQPPTNVRIGTRATTSIQLLFAGPASGSSPATYIVQIANNSGFSGYTQYSNGSGNITMSGLQPGTNYWVRVLSQNASGNSSWVTVSSSTLVGPPGAPTGLSPANITPTAMDVSWTAPSNVGGPNGGLTGWQLDYSLDSSFASGVTTITDSGTWAATTHLSGLLPGNTYYIRVRAESAGGYGPNSATLSQTTLPSTPPTAAATPGVSGRNVSIALTPPSGVTGVDSWKVNLTDTVTNVTTAYTSPSSPLVINGLTPGRAYTYSAAAVIGSYTSPYSTAQSTTMPSPSTAPGSYWDGAKAASADTTYGWTGAADVSTSTATVKAVAGWVVGGFSAPALAVMARASGGFAGTYCGQVTVIRDLAVLAVNSVNPSVRASMIGTSAPYTAAVQPNTTYDSSLYIDTDRDLLMAAEVTWLTSAFAVISRQAGTPVLVHGVDGFTRMNVTAVSPANAAYAIVGAIDVNDGSGRWSQLKSGDVFRVDAAMIMLGSILPYFDGDSADTPYAQYDWLGTANQSVSTLTPLTPVSVDPLADPDVTPIPPAPQPPEIPNEGIIEVATWRRYWVSIPADQIAAFLTEVPSIQLTTGASDTRQVRIRVYENPNGLTPDVFDSSSWVSEQIVSYIPANTEMLIDGVAERVWASIAGGATNSADHLLYGTGGVPATWPVLNCGQAYLMSFDTPLSSPSNNLTVDVSLTRRM